MLGMNKNEIVIFETEDKKITIPVAVDQETVWRGDTNYEAYRK